MDTEKLANTSCNRDLTASYEKCRLFPEIFFPKASKSSILQGKME